MSGYNSERDGQMSSCGIAVIGAAIVLAVALAIAATLAGGWWS